MSYCVVRRGEPPPPPPPFVVHDAIDAVHFERCTVCRGRCEVLRRCSQSLRCPERTCPRCGHGHGDAASTPSRVVYPSYYPRVLDSLDDGVDSLDDGVDYGAELDRRAAYLLQLG